MHPGLLLLTLGLATYRLTRLLVKDSFPLVKGPREAVERWAEQNPRWEALGDLATCPWCASGWVAMALVAAVDLLSDQPVPLPVVMWAAVWAVGALIAYGETRLEPDDPEPAPAPPPKLGASNSNDHVTVEMPKVGATRLEDE